jgi:uncharacterized protein
MSVQAPACEIISVLGEGASVGVPDAVEVAVAVRAAGATVAQALRDHANRAMTLMQMLSAKGVGGHDVRMTPVSVVPVLSPQAAAGVGFGAAPAPLGFTDTAPTMYYAWSTIRIAVADVNRTTELLDAIAAAGQHVTMALSHKVSDEGAVRRSALDAALKDARLKAQALAAATGRQLAQPLSIVEESRPLIAGPAAGIESQPPHVNGAATSGELAARVVIRVSYAVR